MPGRSEEHTSELQSHSEISYAVFCLKKKKVRELHARAAPCPRGTVRSRRRRGMPGRRQCGGVMGFRGVCVVGFFFLMMRRPRRSTLILTLFPYATLFRSKQKTAYEISECDWSSEISYAVFCLRSEEHTSELQSHSEISYAVFCLKKKQTHKTRAPYGRSDSRRCDRGRHRSCLIGATGPIARPGLVFFFFNDTATTEIYTNLNTLSLHDALPIYSSHTQKSRMPSSACDWS